MIVEIDNGQDHEVRTTNEEMIPMKNDLTARQGEIKQMIDEIGSV